MGKYHHGDVRNVLLQKAENILIDEHPQHFRLIFGRERPPLDQYPELRDAADNAFDVLQRAVTSVDRKAEMTLTEAATAYNRALAAWSRAHGIAILVIDGMIAPPADIELDDFVLGLLAEDLNRTDAA